MRLDLFVVEKGLAQSRSRAKSLICDRKILVNGEIVCKPSTDVPLNADVMSLETNEYVGRGALKLEAAFDSLGFCVDGLRAIDIGASTGGFTQVLLRHGAKEVCAVDVGSGQLHSSLRDDPRVVVFENYNARYMEPSDFPELFDVTVCDVSFISQTLIIPGVSRILKPGGEFVTLVKPQFECGREHLGKNGIVKDCAARKSAVERVRVCAIENGFQMLGIIESPIEGGDGNREFVCRFKLNVTDEE